MWEQFIGPCGNNSSLQDNVGTTAVYRTMWEQFIGQCGNSSSLQDNVGTAAVYKKMWEQQQNTGIRCGNSGRISEQELEVQEQHQYIQVSMQKCFNM